MLELPLLERIALRLHRQLYLRTGGRLGGRLRGADLLVLFTKGRRSGERRASILVYIEDEGVLIVAATNRGRASQPAWLLNLLAEPIVEVQLGGRVRAARADVVASNDPRLLVWWQQFDSQLHGWLVKYQSQTARPVRFVRLLLEA